ncbi:MAG: gliding motility-associated C-terminal domain-containing protein [Bacteroidales bacterium]|jgi:gliding motility-associated-like protein|nr:gliding motility-associated C-terminal domain-containing protein [Bacteroidales bacterium]
MNDIDKLFSSLADTEVSSPDIWNKIEEKMKEDSYLNSKNYEQEGNKTTKNNIFSKKLRNISIILGSIVLIGGILYLVLEDKGQEKTTKKEVVSIKKQEKQEEKPLFNSVKTMDNSTKIEIEKTKNKNITLSEEGLEYEIKDEYRGIDNNNEYDIVPLEQNVPKTIVQSNRIVVEEKGIEEKQLDNNEQTLPNISFPNVITPNGDGINDVFVIKNIEYYPENALQIYNQNGKLVYKSKGYKNNFGAENLPLGVYFYKFEYIKKGNKIKFAGSITIML